MCNLDFRFSEPDSISWTWQYCTQWGFLQYANLGDHQLISKYNDQQHQIDICQRQFPDGKSSGLLPAIPDVDRANAFFGGWKMRPSNTYWSGGQFDPWRTLSPLSSESFAPNVTLSQETPDCGATTSSDTIFGYTMENAEHAFDFRTTFPGGAQSRTYFTNALTKWLKCWKSGVKPENPSDILQEGRIGFSQMDSMRTLTVQN